MTDQQALNRLSANIKALRQAQGLSLRQLADLVGTYPSNIKRIEDKENLPGVGFLTRIAEILNVTPNDLLGISTDETADHKKFSHAS